jgi:hypothetical protein
MTNTEAKAILSAAFPAITWRIGSQFPWASVYGRVSEHLEFVVMPPDVPGHPKVIGDTWLCLLRPAGVDVTLRDGETLPELVRRASIVLTERAVDVARAVTT